MEINYLMEVEMIRMLLWTAAALMLALMVVPLGVGLLEPGSDIDYSAPTAAFEVHRYGTFAVHY